MLTPGEAARTYITAGAAKTRLSAVKMLILGFFAGAFIALAGLGATTASATVGSASLAKLIGGLVFPAGLSMVVICGAELFTGNCLIIISVLSREAKLSGMLKNWAFVYVGNLLGGLAVAALAVYGHTLSLFDGGLAAAVVSAAETKASLGFGDAFIRGVLCNVLVCVAVFMALCAQSVGGKLAGLFFPIMLFVVCGFEHSIANMYYLPAGILAAAEYGIESGLGWGGFVSNLIPVTLGNIVGGLAVGAGLYFALLSPARERTTEKP